MAKWRVTWHRALVEYYDRVIEADTEDQAIMFASLDDTLDKRKWKCRGIKSDIDMTAVQEVEKNG